MFVNIKNIQSIWS